MTKTKLANQTRSLIPKGLGQRIGEYGSILFILYFLEGLLLLVIKLATDAPIDVLTRDPLAVQQVDHVGKPYVGFLSNFGILLWCSAAAICLFSSYLLQKSGNREVPKFFLASAILTFILLIDDLFMIHEEVFPNYLNLSEKLLYLGYAMFMLWYLSRFRRILLKTDWMILLLAGFQFFMSITLDIIVPLVLPLWAHHHPLIYLLEDGTKLLGITSWLVYFTVTCTGQVRQGLPSLPLAG